MMLIWGMFDDFGSSKVVTSYLYVLRVRRRWEELSSYEYFRLSTFDFLLVTLVREEP